MIKFKKKVLDNGLRVIVVPMENTKASTLMVLVGVGSRYETKNINGISHFLEHLFFKGTKNRPKLGQISHELDKIGAAHNAFTSKEITGFWVKSAAKDFDIGLDVVSDILLEPLFKEEEIETERGVILQEINMYEDEPRRKVWEILENVLYGGQPIGRDIIGTSEIIKKIKREEIVDYRAKNYLAGNMIVVVAGDVDQKKTFDKIEKHFKKIKKGKNKNYQKEKTFQKTSQIKVINKELDQTHLALGVRAYDMYDKKKHTLNMLGVILGGNCSSRLYMEIREKLGLAYYVFAGGDQYMDCGYLGIGVGVAHDKLDITVNKIGEIFKSLKQKGVSKKELEHAKSFLRGQMALGLETSDEIANFCAGRELFYNEIIQPEEVLKRIEKVTQNDILKVAQDIFNPNKLNTAIISAQDNIDEKKLCKKIMS